MCDQAVDVWVHMVWCCAIHLLSGTEQHLMQAEDASEERLEMSREFASLRLRLTAATQQAEEYRKELGLAQASPTVAEQHEAALAGLRQEISALRKEVAQMKASM